MRLNADAIEQAPADDPKAPLTMEEYESELAKLRFELDMQLRETDELKRQLEARPAEKLVFVEMKETAQSEGKEEVKESKVEPPATAE